MRQEHIDFLELNIHHKETLAAGYVRNLDKQLLDTYEGIYRQYIDKDFILTKWCSTCVYDCLKRIYDYYDAHVLSNRNVVSVSHGTNDFIFPDDLDKIEPTGEENIIDNKGKRKGRPKKLNG